MSGALRDRVIVILGGAKGIGAATARLAHAAGARVVVGDIRLPPHESHLAYVERVDVRSRRELGQFRENILAHVGPIDIVVNCAAVIAAGPFQHADPDALARQIDVNVTGTINVTRAFLPAFLAQESGHFIHVSSLGGIVPMPYSAVYAATKFAVRGFCLSVAPELEAAGLRMSVVCPDSTDTDQLYTEAQQGGAPVSFIGRPMAPDTVAEAILTTVDAPQRETLVPRRRWVLAALVGAGHHVFERLYPLFHRIGERGRASYVATRPTRIADSGVRQPVLL